MKRTIFYKKFMISYNIIIFTFLFITNLVLIKNIQKKDTIYNQKINERMVNNIYDIFNRTENFVSNFMFELYSDDVILEDTMYLLNNDLIEYFKHKIDKFCLSNKSYYNGIQYFIKTNFQRNNYIKSIEILSYKTNTSYLFERDNNLKKKTLSISEMDKNFLQSTEENSDEILYIRNLNNPKNLKVEGSIIFKMDKNIIKNTLENYEEILRLLILKQNGLILYDSNQEEINFIDISNIINKYKDNVNIKKVLDDFVIMGVAENETTFISNPELIVYIIIFDIIVFIAFEFFIFKRLKKMNNRLNLILDTMTNINNNGDYTLKRIPKEAQTEKDEISIFCEKFNIMCGELEEYANKYYVSLINEKNAEMKMLQNSINPHFLYNTLESIRMKAIINNDREVAKMIFILAHLFRNQLKEKDIITIKNELEYCNKFLEIYKFRYPEKFTYSLDCEEELLEQTTIKFVLQPLLENYFVHGIKLENNDNILNIKIKRILNYINIIMEDNGKGIEKYKLEELRVKIKNNEIDSSMVGILNVNQRIKIKYGEKYGLHIQSEEGKGTTISVKLPYKEM